MTTALGAVQGLSLKRVVEICLAQKTASKNVQRQQESQPTQSTVNAMSQSRGKQQGRHACQERGERSERGCCLRCDNPTHHSDDCRFKETVCNYCKKKGHF